MKANRATSIAASLPGIALATLIVFVIAALLIGGPVAEWRHATYEKIFGALGPLNPLDGPLQASLLLIALISVLIVVDDALHAGAPRRRDDSSDEG